MPGKHITDQQVRRYMQSRKDGYGQATAAARAGFSESTARRIEKNPVLPSQRDRVRLYRTRSDPFADVWQ
jgi:DNA-binding XRE family transcriptional regulator